MTKTYKQWAREVHEVMKLQYVYLALGALAATCVSSLIHQPEPIIPSIFLVFTAGSLAVLHWTEKEVKKQQIMTTAVERITTIGAISINPREGYTERDVLLEFIKSPEGDRILTKDIHNIYHEAQELIYHEPEYSLVEGILKDGHAIYLLPSEEKNIPADAAMYSMDGLHWIKLKKI